MLIASIKHPAYPAYPVGVNLLAMSSGEIAYPVNANLLAMSLGPEISPFLSEFLP